MQAAFTAGRKGGPLRPPSSSKSSKLKPISPPAAAAASTSTMIPPPSLYLSLHLTLSFLLVFSFGFLPRTDLLFSDFGSSTETAQRRTSLDRPEHPFMTAITSDPARTMNYEVVGVWICMVWWGGWMRSWWRQERISKGEMKLAGGIQSGDALEAVESRKFEARKKLVDFRNAILSTLLLSPLTFLVLILLGAPITSQVRKTYLLALHFTILLVHPVVYALGLPSLYEGGSFDRYRLRRLFSEMDLRTSLERATILPPFLAILGAWVGVIPLALDWDRPWQAYPLPPAFGSLIGWAVGGLLVWGRAVVDVVEGEVRAAEVGGADRVGEAVGGKTKKGKKGLKAE